MTCIIGVVHNGAVWIGGDSASVGEDGAIASVKQRKVFQNGDCLFGCAGGWTQINALFYDLDPPDPSSCGEDGADYFVQRELVPAARAAVTSAGIDDSACDPFLVGLYGRLFIVDSDWHVEEPLSKIAALGHGAQVGLGAVAASKLVPPSRILKALKIAAEHAPGVRAPFYVEKV